MSDHQTDTQFLLNSAGPLLTKEEEVDLFTRLRGIDAEIRDFARIPGKKPYQHAQWAAAKRRRKKIEDRIVAANLRLVVKITQKKIGPGTAMGDLVSEGLLKILECIKVFDVTRGYRFSTYLYTSMYRHFGRHMQKEARRQAGRIDESVLEDEAYDEGSHEIAELQDVMRDNIAGLTDLEMKVIRYSFGMGLSKVTWGAMSQLLNEGGFGKINIPRLKAIQAGALVKLRGVMAGDE